jgi:hypothetical protein
LLSILQCRIHYFSRRREHYVWFMKRIQIEGLVRSMKLVQKERMDFETVKIQIQVSCSNTEFIWSHYFVQKKLFVSKFQNFRNKIIRRDNSKALEGITCTLGRELQFFLTRHITRCRKLIPYSNFDTPTQDSLEPPCFLFSNFNENETHHQTQQNFKQS